MSLLVLSCSQAARVAPQQRPAVASDVEVAAQALPPACNESCPEPLSCICGVCAAPCENDEACGRYSGNANCVAPSEDACTSEARACDVPCTHDGICEHLGRDVICLVGHCRHVPRGSVRGDAATEEPGQLATCGARPAIAGMCVLARDVEPEARFTNERALLEGTILAVGEGQADPNCFGSANRGAVIPVAPHDGEPPLVPQGTLWWRVTDGTTEYTVGVAAPGLDALRVAAGDSISLRHAVSWGGKDWAFGNAEIEIAGKGNVLIAVNDTSRLMIQDGPAQCERPGPCGGREWSMRIALGSETIVVAPFQSVQHGRALFTNAGTLTHHRDYVESDETGRNDPRCKEEPRSNYLAARVEAL